MAPKRHRRMPDKASEKPRKDRATTARKAELEMEQVKEAEMETRVLEAARKVTVVCPKCGQRTEFESRNGIPIAPCPNCGTRLGLGRPGYPEVVSR